MGTIGNGLFGLLILLVGWKSCSPKTSTNCNLTIHQMGYADTTMVHLSWTGSTSLWVLDESGDSTALAADSVRQWFYPGVYSFTTSTTCKLSEQVLHTGGIYTLSNNKN